MQGIHRKERENRKRKTHLTHTGLLMEGLIAKVGNDIGMGRKTDIRTRTRVYTSSHGTEEDGVENYLQQGVVHLHQLFLEDSF
jgi:hypothetical protein